MYPNPSPGGSNGERLASSDDFHSARDGQRTRRRRGRWRKGSGEIGSPSNGCVSGASLDSGEEEEEMSGRGCAGNAFTWSLCNKAKQISPAASALLSYINVDLSTDIYPLGAGLLYADWPMALP